MLQPGESHSRGFRGILIVVEGDVHEEQRLSRGARGQRLRVEDVKLPHCHALQAIRHKRCSTTIRCLTCSCLRLRLHYFTACMTLTLLLHSMCNPVLH